MQWKESQERIYEIAGRQQMASTRINPRQIIVAIINP